eukprot:Gregarina_sp_Pseudo_9__2148@NODE_24_length_5670_cov_13_762742_g22_i0_p1_GENE_NODE_24_length_5670_cov_13_762742_g22_i0NODE_24_length_5670_cov_13_762742_g22_i0_p1_ORF_typecomplete_len970_score220_64ABC2_membrane/PF01061_24/0_026ABC2_membrane/PF01061_24/1_7e27ABC_tran/PF00005_27/4e26ABC2_membrane_3/PF12698_7/2_9e03ABC2_membrane_3/PF12698_7/4_2e09AAA_16/PF13191_6/0_00011AAA_16/PF13191_6/1_6e03AAA_21/PF13304_6/3_4AAA_21/PF13304_6/0_04ATPase_2/PF01637_18/0_0016AAA_29/PF13555_6/0_0046AAA_29/PF13555_6/3
MQPSSSLKTAPPPCLRKKAIASQRRSPVTVTTHNLSHYIPIRTVAQKLFPCAFTSKLPTANPTGTPVDPAKGFELLRDVTMVAHPNELTAVIGPSGCGKTTLLNILGQRARGKSTGTVAYNNVIASHKALKGCVSMCYANERLLPYLTVEETLFFATILKMGQTTAAQRQMRVNEVIEELALDHIRHTRIGGVWGKGISTGEARRTAIGVELIGDPAVLLLDEPTSGLDAVLAFEIMFVLKALATRGRTVICSVHQPRAAIFELFDSLVLMSRGQVLYHGRSHLARAWLTTEAGVSVSGQVNTPDALIDVASTRPCKKARSKQEDMSAGEIAEAFKNSAEMQSIKRTIEAVHSQDASTIRLLERNPFAQWFVEVGAVCFRSFRNSMRNPLSFSLVLVIQALMGCFLGAIFYKLPDQYLPTEMPADIGSEQSSIMFMFNNTVTTFVKSGIDGQGYNPLLELVVSGVDGNKSEPLLTLNERGVLRSLYNSMDCVHEKLELEQCYASADLSGYNDLWGTSSEGDEEWAGGYDLSAPQLTSYLIKDMQVLDYALAKFDYTNAQNLFAYLTVNSGSYFNLGLPCYTDVREIAFAFSGCSGVPALPFPSPYGTGLTSLAGTCKFIRNGNVPAVKSAFRCEDRAATPQADRIQPPDLGANADRGGERRRLQPQRRRLQAAAMITGSADDLLAALPPVLVGILNRLPEYQAAFTECPHEFCRLLETQMQSTEGTSGEVREGLQALAEYGAVLGAVMNIVGALFFSIGNIGFASYDALVSFPQERAMTNREISNYAYKPSSYFIGKTIADMTFQLAPSMLLVIFFYFLVGVERGVHGILFWRYFGICALTIFAAYGFAYLASALSPSMEVAVVGAPLVLVIFLCCSGFFVRDAGVPDGLTWVKYLSFYRWGFFGLILNQFPPGESYGGVPNSFSLAVAGINEQRMSVCCGALVALGIGFRLLAYLALKFLHRKIGIEE